MPRAKAPPTLNITRGTLPYSSSRTETCDRTTRTSDSGTQPGLRVDFTTVDSAAEAAEYLRSIVTLCSAY